MRRYARSKLKDYQFLLVSNREPYIHKKVDDNIVCERPAGGLTAALDPLMRACGGTWIAWGSGDADKDVVDDKDRVGVPPESPKYALKRVWMTDEQVDKFYFGFANQALWPLCHYVYEKPVFDSTFWEGYEYSNELFSKAILEEIEKHDKIFLWVHDYHLALVPKLVRESSLAEEKDVVIADFWHIPWPSWEVFSICPWAAQILTGLLGNDLMGLHLPQHCSNFLESMRRILGLSISHEKGCVEHDDGTTAVRSFPISVDFDAIDAASRREEVEDQVRRIRSNEVAPFPYIGVGIDRLDYTKGIVERFKAIDYLLEKNTGLVGKFVFVEAAAPSRVEIPAYQQLREDIINFANRVNEKHEKDGWKPILYLEEKLQYDTLLAFYRTADICMVSSLHDGMNLVAKEFLSANVDEKGVLILSKFAGAAKELQDALLVNPYDVQEFAEAINTALTIAPDKRKALVSSLRKVVREKNIYQWLQDFIREGSRYLGNQPS
ncbi:MAG: trehalose-6-phosphate synthase [Thermoplasmata archaeon]